MDEYISIADFATLANVSKQAVYKRLEKDLVSYCKTEGRNKVISKSALELFNSTNSTQPVEQPESTNSTDKIIQLLEKDNDQLNNQLSEIVEMLKREQTANAELRQQLITLSGDFAELAKQSNALLSQSHQLQALNAPKPVEQPVNPVDGDSVEIIEPVVQGKKKGFFNRLFG